MQKHASQPGFTYHVLGSTANPLDSIGLPFFVHGRQNMT